MTETNYVKMWVVTWVTQKGPQGSARFEMAKKERAIALAKKMRGYCVLSWCGGIPFQPRDDVSPRQAYDYRTTETRVSVP